MKDHKKTTRRVDLPDMDGPLDDVVERLHAWQAVLLSTAKDLKNPVLVEDTNWDAPPDYYIEGWRPMTEKELAAQKRRRQRDRERAEEKRRAQREKDRQLYEELKREFEGDS